MIFLQDCQNGKDCQNGPAGDNCLNGKESLNGYQNGNNHFSSSTDEPEANCCDNDDDDMGRFVFKN